MKRSFIILLCLWMIVLAPQALAEQLDQRDSLYTAYRARHAGIPWAQADASAEITASSGGRAAEAISGEKGVSLQGGEWVEYTVTVPEDALYWIALRYCALPGTVQDVELALTMDGEQPFSQAGFCLLPRTWQDDGPFTYDNNGNQIRPGQQEITLWREETLYDYDGSTDSEYLFYLASGEHTIRLHALSEPVALGALTLRAPVNPPAYADVKAAYAAQGYASVSGEICLEQQAEQASRRYALYPLAESDYTSPSSTPSSPTKIVYNVLGGEQWVFCGQRVEWAFTVPESGLYQLNFKYRQNYSRGMEAYRRILVDGELLCEEMRAVSFPYGDDWQNMTVSAGGEPILIYLEKDVTHTISMAPAIRPLSELLGTLEDVVYELNAWYRQIITVTSTNPDLYRDYYLNKEIPGLMEGFASISATLTDTAEAYEAFLGVSGSELSPMFEAAKQLDDFVERADRIPSRLTELKNNISALTDLRRSLMELPMQLDTLSLSGEGAALPAANRSFVETLIFRLRAFLGSFTENYNAVGNVYADTEDSRPLEVWVSANDMATTGASSGRDQMTLLKQLIDDQFVPQTGIAVNVSLVDSSSTLTQAIVAGEGPDIALIIPSGTPVTLAMRGALQDLTEFDLSEIYPEFHENAFFPYEYDGGLYALPETQTFSMLFYRTDVFEELGIEVPQTWEDFYRVIPIIQKQNLQIGFSEDLTLFAMFLMQQGGSYYTEDLSATGFDTPAAIAAFKQWSDLYTKYSFPLYFDAFNRFRTGEIPLMVQNYSFYCTLEAAAPELKGLWAMAPLPGVMQEDGSINRAQPGGGTACMMMSHLPNKEDAFAFLKWWVSAEVQAAFGQSLESTLGVAGRYPTANQEAFLQLPWTLQEREVLLEQWSQVRPLENLPGSYYITRSLTNAFRRVVYYYENPRETLLRYNEDMNTELMRKRIEYGLD